MRKSLLEWCKENNKEYLLDEWDYERNEKTPNTISKGAEIRIHWKCKNDETHLWVAYLSNYLKGRRCPYCSGRYPIKGKNDLQTINPILSSEWHPTKNMPLTPSNVKAKSNKKVWWLCNKGHEWQANINSRSNGYGCPYCSGRYPVKGENDFQTISPILSSEWHPTKNIPLTPSDVKPKSNKKVWWLCSKGHEWQATINNRYRKGYGCPYCSGKVLTGDNDLETVNPELALEWHPFKNKPLKPSEIYYNATKCVWWICKEGHEWKNSISERNKGKECPICKYKKENNNPKKILVLKNRISISLATKHPELLEEWDYSKNKEISPHEVSYGSGKKVWWICKKNSIHKWKAAIYDRISGNGCPICSGQVLSKGNNDFKTIYPDLAKEWHPTKNGKLTPSDVTYGSGIKVWWLCDKGHEYQANIYNRGSGKKCPYCQNKKVLIGFNDLQTTYPDLAKEWHPTKNGKLTPNDVTYGSEKKVWWLCNCGYEWNTTVNTRTSLKCGCIKCNPPYSSKGENAVAIILNKKQIEYKRQFIVPERGRLRDDFALLSQDKKIVGTIEYNGQQHYEPVDFAGKGEEWANKNFEIIQKRDRKKSEWLKEHNIPQLIIPYWEFDNIPSLVNDYCVGLGLL